MVTEGWALRKQAGDFAVRKAIVVATLLRLYDILEPQHQDGMRLREMNAPEDQYSAAKFVHKHLEVGLLAVQQSEEDGGHDPITRSGRFCSMTRHLAEMVILTAFRWGWIHVRDSLSTPCPSALCEKIPFGTSIRCKAVANVHTSGEHIWAATVTLLTKPGNVDNWAYCKFALDRSGYLYSFEKREDFTVGTILPELSNTTNKGLKKRVWDNTTQGINLTKVIQRRLEILMRPSTTLGSSSTTNLKQCSRAIRLVALPERQNQSGKANGLTSTRSTTPINKHKSGTETSPLKSGKATVAPGVMSR